MAVIEERTSPEGAKSYRVKIRLKGQKTVSETFDKKTDAKLWAQKTEAEMRKWKRFPDEMASSRTVADLIDHYLRLELPKRRDRQKTELHLNWWKENLGYLELSNLTPARLAEARDELLQTPTGGPGKKKKIKTPATVNRYLASMSHALSVAATEWNWLQHNPMKNVRKPQESRLRIRFLSDDERNSLLKACKESPCDYLYTVVVLALSTGARYAEIMNLKWEDVDFERKMARLNKTKNQERRAIPITHHAHELLLELQERAAARPQAFIFARADGKSPLEIRKHWYAAVEGAGIEDFRFHDLRHTAASYLAMNGATLAEIAEILGHKTLQMVKRYAHLSDQHVTGVVEKMNKKIFVDMDDEEV